MDILQEITVFADGKQNVSGLKETLIQAYGNPVKNGVINEMITWEGKKVSLTFMTQFTNDESAHATFRSKEVEARLKAMTEKKAKEGAIDASKQL